MKVIKYETPGCYPHVFKPGLYHLKIFGAQGGQCNTTVPYGGQTTGSLPILSTTTYYICVGGKGVASYSGEGKGGFNGGGNTGAQTKYGFCGGSGGGQSDIREKQGQPSTAIIIAGGGGGDGTFHDHYPGGRGGGQSGEDGKGTYIRGGKGGTSEKGGDGGYYAGSPSQGFSSCNGENGSPFQGGNGCSTAVGRAGGGGGGYFGGGGAADLGGGGGGSSFISSLILKGSTNFSTRAGDGAVYISFVGEKCTYITIPRRFILIYLFSSLFSK